MKSSKSNSIYIAILLLCFALLVYVQITTPKPIDWTLTFDKNDKNPYGTFLVFERLADIFPNQDIEVSQVSIYEQIYRLRDEGHEDFNYIIINEKFNPEEEDEKALLDFVKNKGAHIFIAAEDYKQSFKEKLGFKLNTTLNLADSLSLNFVHPDLKNKNEYEYRSRNTPFYFTKYKDKNTAILASNSLNKPVLLKIKYGKGYFYISSTPVAYSNYNLLWRNNADYIAKSFSFLPQKTICWDEYYKKGREENKSPLRFILKTDSLRWAWLTAIAGVLLFIIFEAKRKQRVIPIIKPLTNSTLEFTQTIGRLYFQSGNHKNIADKKITFFLEYIRSHFYLKTNLFDAEFYKNISKKSGYSIPEVEKLFKFIIFLQDQKSVSEFDLAKLSKQIDEFKARQLVR